MASGRTGAARWLVRGTLAAGFAALAATAVQAAPTAPTAPTTKAVEATGSVTRAVATEEPVEAPGCTKARRRLWVESEGWIVRRITTCH